VFGPETHVILKKKKTVKLVGDSQLGQGTSCHVIRNVPVTSATVRYW